MTLDEYGERCKGRIALRDKLKQDFLDSQGEFVECGSCNSRLNVEKASRLYTYAGMAKCLVCHNSLFPPETRQKITDLIAEADSDYNSLSAEERYGHGRASSCHSWTSLQNKTSSIKKKKWWAFWR